MSLKWYHTCKPSVIQLASSPLLFSLWLLSQFKKKKNHISGHCILLWSLSGSSIVEFVSSLPASRRPERELCGVVWMTRLCYFGGLVVVMHKLYKLNQCAHRRCWHIITSLPHAAARCSWWLRAPRGVVWRHLRRLWALFSKLNLCSLKVSRSPRLPPPPLVLALPLTVKDRPPKTRSLPMNVLHDLRSF